MAGSPAMLDPPASTGKIGPGVERFNNPWCSFVISPSGWDALDEMIRTSRDSSQAFVAMSFAKELIPVWRNGIKPALERAEYRAYRVDDDPHIGRIDAKIMTEIKNSRFVIADVTDLRPGVYFEAGYAMGLRLPVISNPAARWRRIDAACPESPIIATICRNPWSVQARIRARSKAVPMPRRCAPLATYTEFSTEWR